MWNPPKFPWATGDLILCYCLEHGPACLYSKQTEMPQVRYNGRIHEFARDTRTLITQLCTVNGDWSSRRIGGGRFSS